MNKRAFVLLLMLMSVLLPSGAKGDTYPVLDGFVVDSSVSFTGTEIRAVAVQPWDGKVIIGGLFDIVQGGITVNKNLARLNVDGTLDASFTISADGPVNSIAIQPDANSPSVPEKSLILVGGSFAAITMTTGGASQPRNGLARIKNDLTLDSFNPLLSANPVVDAITLPITGDILIAGKFTESSAGVTYKNVARLFLVDGSFKGNFGGGTDDEVYAVVMQKDNVVIGGNFSSPAHNVARFTAGDVFDLTFAGSTDGAVRSLAVQPDGQILMGGDFTAVNLATRNYLARLTAAGALDGFDAGLGSLAGADRYLTSMALQSDGKILVGGNFTKVGSDSITRNHLARVRPDGALDNTINLDPDHAVNAVTLVSDDRFLVGGKFTQVGTKPRMMLARVYSNGALDDDVSTQAASYPVDNQVLTISQQPDGALAIGGVFSSLGAGAYPRARLAKLNPDWSVADKPDLNLNFQVESIAPQPDGGLVVGGLFTDPNYWTTLRLDANGNPDTVFDSNALTLKMLNTPAISLGPTHALAIAPSGLFNLGEPVLDIYLGAETGNGPNNFYLAKLDGSGQLDVQFGTNIGNISPATL